MTLPAAIADCREPLVRGLVALDIAAEPTLVEPLLHFLALLSQWNAAYNLTAVREPREMVGKHLLDALAVLPEARGQRLVDVGTGAGIPGIPLMLAGACTSALLIDSNGKKVRFCKHVIGELGLSSRIEARQARIEAVAAADGGDRVISRAFAALGDFITGAGGLVRPGGELLAMKGRLEQVSDERKQLPPGWTVIAERHYAVPDIAGERVLLRCARA